MDIQRFHVWIAAFLLAAAQAPGELVRTRFMAPGFDFAAFRAAPPLIVVDTGVEVTYGLRNRFDSDFGSGKAFARRFGLSLAARLSGRSLVATSPLPEFLAELKNDTAFQRTRPKHILIARKLQLDQGVIAMPGGGTAAITLVLCELEILDAASMRSEALLTVTPGLVGGFTLRLRLIDAVNQVAEKIADHLASARTPAVDSVLPDRNLVYGEPIKWAGWAADAQVYRLSLARQSGKKLYLLKYSQFFQGHKPQSPYGAVDDERAGTNWFRLGGGIRLASAYRGSGGFLEADLNLVRWRFEKTDYRYAFTGIQPYVYGGYNYLGDRFFFTAGMGIGANLGIHGETPGTSAQTSSYTPLALSPYVAADAEIGVGIFF